VVVLPRGGRAGRAAGLGQGASGATNRTHAGRAHLAVPRVAHTTAETNCMGFVSRSREWGLVLPRLLDGRYLLTTLGVALVEQAEARVPARPGGE